MASNETIINPMFETVSKEGFIISISIFTAIAGVVNLFVACCILLSRMLRTSSKHLIILALNVCSIYNSVFVLPLIIQYFIEEKWVHDCGLLIAIDYRSTFVTLSIESLLIIALAIDYLIQMTAAKKPKAVAIALAMIVAAVVVSVAVLLPITYTGEIINVADGSCYVNMPMWVQLTRNILSILPQAFTLFVFFVVLSAITCCCSRPGINKTFDIVSACALIILLEVPFTCYLIFFNACFQPQCQTARTVLLMFTYLRPCLQSFVWFLCPQTRKGIRQICCCFSEDDNSSRSELPAFTGIDNHFEKGSNMRL